ncbi:MAG: FkbM family methyltransferase [archaeon]
MNSYFKRIPVFVFRLLRQIADTVLIKCLNAYYAFKVILEVKNWKDYLLNSQNISNQKQIIFELRNGTKFITRTKTKDRDIFVETAIADQYRTDKIFLDSKSAVLDIGAQAGFFSVFISRRVGKVFAFEPVPENFELLKKNLALNNRKNRVVAFNKAVAGKNGKQKIFLSENNTGGHSFFGKSNLFGKNKGFIECNTISLENVFSENKLEKCDLLKMDAEGAEYEILFNAPDKILEKITRISMEAHFVGKNRPEHLIEFLSSKGFKVKKRKHYGDVLLFAEQKGKNTKFI